MISTPISQWRSTPPPTATSAVRSNKRKCEEADLSLFFSLLTFSQLTIDSTHIRQVINGELFLPPYLNRINGRRLAEGVVRGYPLPYLSTFLDHKSTRHAPRRRFLGAILAFPVSVPCHPAQLCVPVWHLQVLF
jgi:hypothetical protein